MLKLLALLVSPVVGFARYSGRTFVTFHRQECEGFALRAINLHVSAYVVNSFLKQTI